MSLSRVHNGDYVPLFTILTTFHLSPYHDPLLAHHPPGGKCRTGVWRSATGTRPASRTDLETKSRPITSSPTSTPGSNGRSENTLNLHIFPKEKTKKSASEPSPQSTALSPIYRPLPNLIRGPPNQYRHPLQPPSETPTHPKPEPEFPTHLKPVRVYPLPTTKPVVVGIRVPTVGGKAMAEGKRRKGGSLPESRNLRKILH